MRPRQAPLLFVLAGAVLAQAPPSFEQFAATETFSGKPAAPTLKTAGQRMFRTRIREAAAKGPNFAGHYTIAEWGCGSGCVSIALIDSSDGRVFDGPFQTLSWDLVNYEGKYPSNANGFVPLSFHRDSRLLVARGCPQDKDCASYFYEWTGSQFKLLRKIPAVPLPN